ncbi:hypothetical protein [Algivirga pacifica]
MSNNFVYIAGFIVIASSLFPLMGYFLDHKYKKKINKKKED